MNEKKRAVIGIGTLIIFISMILVAATAAGVIIRTSGILQERAFAVGGEARKRLVTGVEVVEVIGTADLEDNTIPQLEIYLRTTAGSRDVQLRTTGMTFSTEDVALSARLQHKELERFNEDYAETGEITSLDTDWYQMEVDFGDDFLDDRVRVVNGSEAGTSDPNEMVLQFNITSELELGDGDLISIPLGVDYSGTDSRSISLTEEQITPGETGRIYGFVDIHGNITSDEYLNISELDQFRVKQFPENNVCRFDKLIPEDFFCYESRMGDEDSVLESGELYIIRYHLTEAREIEEEEGFEMKFVPKDGSVTFLEGSPPGVIGNKKITLWPS